MCLAVAAGASYPNLTLGLGSVHPNCRVSYFGSVDNDAMVAWRDTTWIPSSEALPDYDDAALTLDYLFPQLDAGASVTFTWSYILTVDTLNTALSTINSLTITQPTTTVSGNSVVFCAVTAVVALSVTFTITNATTVSPSELEPPETSSRSRVMVTSRPPQSALVLPLAVCHK